MNSKIFFLGAIMFAAYIRKLPTRKAFFLMMQ